jgi:hypothetical protein
MLTNSSYFQLNKSRLSRFVVDFLQSCIQIVYRVSGFFRISRQEFHRILHTLNSLLMPGRGTLCLPVYLYSVPHKGTTALNLQMLLIRFPCGFDPPIYNVHKLKPKQMYQIGTIPRRDPPARWIFERRGNAGGSERQDTLEYVTDLQRGRCKFSSQYW